MRKNGKKLLSLALALVMVLGLLPEAAWAADFPPAGSAYWTYVKDDQTGVDLLSTPPPGLVFVYFSLTCLNSQQRVPLMEDYLEKNGIHAYAYVHQDNLPRTKSAIFRVGNVSTLTWPAVVICGTDGQTVDFYSNCTLDTLKNALESHGLTSGSDTPSDDSNTPSDNTSTLLNDSSMNSKAWEVLRLTNQHRMEIGLSPLSSTDAMQMAANQRAQELTVKYDHMRPDGSDCFSVMEDYKIPYSVVAENIAYGYENSAGVMNGWLNSSGHRANIEHSGLVHLGVGATSDFWSQNFAGSSNCSYGGISLSRSSATGTAGQDLEDILLAANITVRSDCAVHGGSYLPLIAAMCTGYDANSAGAQTVTVSLGGRSTSLTINLTASAASAYTVTLNANGGSLSGYTTMTTSEDGRLSGLPTPTRSGYTFNGWYTSASGGTRVTTSTVFTEDTTIYARWTPVYDGKDDTPTATFADVPSTVWYYEAVYWAVNRGITAGTSATTFTPDRTCTETEILTFLWRAAGQPDSTAWLPFTPKAAWAADALTWAYEKGMIGASFNEGAPCTRASTAKFIWQSAGSPAASGATGFTDVSAGAGYAAAVAWAVEQGITQGTGAGAFSPDKTCTRAEIVTFLYRAYK